MPNLRSKKGRFFTIKLEELRNFLEDLYAKLNRREFVHPDPLEFLYNYNDPLDREIVGFIASSLAYGRVNQILKSVSKVLEPMGKSPRLFIEKTSTSRLAETYGNFKHRFTTGSELVELVEGMKATFAQHGSLNLLFASTFKTHGINDAILTLTTSVKCRCSLPNHSMVPSPDKDSACKRLWLFLRWMVRQDEVDPGGWVDVSPSLLVVPLDTHMFQLSKKLGLTSRNQANMKTAVEITESFREINLFDPVKYDFCLTRLGIHPEVSKQKLI